MQERLPAANGLFRGVCTAPGPGSQALGPNKRGIGHCPDIGGRAPGIAWAA